MEKSIKTPQKNQSLFSYVRVAVNGQLPEGYVRPELNEKVSSVADVTIVDAEIEDNEYDNAEVEAVTVPTKKRPNSASLYKGQRMEIVQHCLENGNTNTLKAFSHLHLNDRTLRGWMVQFHKEGKVCGSTKRWSSRCLPEILDKKLDEILRDIIASGQEIHELEVITHAKILLESNGLSSSLKENGGKIVLSKHWSSEWLAEHKYRDKMHTQNQYKKLMNETILTRFVAKVCITIVEFNIPPVLIGNMDETGLHLTPAGNSSFVKIGQNQVKKVGHGDKRQITATFGANYLGEKFGIQLIFKGKTNSCLPKTRLDNFLYSYSETHWQDITTNISYLKVIVFPFFVSKRVQHNLPPNQYALLLVDVWYSHLDASVLKLCEENYCKIAVIEPGFTGDLQVMDLVCNKPVKSTYKVEFRSYCAKEISDQLKMGVLPQQAQLNLNLKNLKENIPRWLESAWKSVDSKTIADCFEKILGRCFDEEFQVQAQSMRNEIYPNGAEILPEESQLEFEQTSDRDSDSEEFELASLDDSDQSDQSLVPVVSSALKSLHSPLSSLGEERTKKNIVDQSSFDQSSFGQLDRFSNEIVGEGELEQLNEDYLPEDPSEYQIGMKVKKLFSFVDDETNESGNEFVYGKIVNFVEDSSSRMKLKIHFDDKTNGVYLSDGAISHVFIVAERISILL